MTTRKPTGKQSAFIDFYLIDFNATNAARKAGYKGSYNTLKSVGCENLTKPYIRAEIERRLKDRHMSGDEAIARLTQQAKSSIADFVDIGEDGLVINPDAIKYLGHLIKKIKDTKHGVEIELHDQQKALELIGKVCGLFRTKVDVDWRGEIEALGYSAGDVFNQLVGELLNQMEESESDD